MCSFLKEILPTQQLHRMRLAFDMFRGPSMCTPRPLARISLQLAIHRPGASPLRGPSFFSHAAYMYSPFCDGLMLVSHVASTPCTLHPPRCTQAPRCRSTVLAKAGSALCHARACKAGDTSVKAYPPLPQSWPEQGSHNPGEHDNIQEQF